jgi:hypothetical protein
MSHKKSNPKKSQTRRPLVFVLLGVLLFASAAFLITSRVKGYTTITSPPPTYYYITRQSLKDDVQYRRSSFFNSAPDQGNTAYLADITDNVKAQLHYAYSASDATDLHYTYEANAVVQSLYGSRDGTESSAVVWSKQYSLLNRVQGTQKTITLSFDPTITIPFSEYKQKTEQFKNAFNAPVTSEAVVTFTVNISGKANGTPFTDRKTSTLTIPLDQQVFKIASKFTAEERHEVIPPESAHVAKLISRYQVSVAMALIVGGFISTVYGIRKQIIKSPYQRELEKIYRYYNGIIINAGRLTNLAHKNVVMVQDFEDLLNLEEEIKTPIIASKVSDVTTHFLIARDDIVYVYTLGQPVPFKPPATDERQTTPHNNEQNV